MRVPVADRPAGDCASMRTVRERCGLSRTQVARRLHWPAERLGRFERGHAIPSAEEASELARLYQARWLRVARRRDAHVLAGSDPSAVPAIFASAEMSTAEARR